MVRFFDQRGDLFLHSYQKQLANPLIQLSNGKVRKVYRFFPHTQGYTHKGAKLGKHRVKIRVSKLLMAKDLKSVLSDKTELFNDIDSIKKIADYRKRYEVGRRILKNYESLSAE